MKVELDLTPDECLLLVDAVNGHVDLGPQTDRWQSLDMRSLAVKVRAVIKIQKGWREDAR